MPRFKPDIVEPGISRIVEKIQQQKQGNFKQDAMPLIRQLARQSQLVQPTVEAPPTAPVWPRAASERSEALVLPESPHVFKEPQQAAQDIYMDALAGGKNIRHPEGFKAGTARRLAGEESIYMKISNELASTRERGDFHKYLSALWGSDSPEVVRQVRDHMLKEFPQYAMVINKHLSDAAISGLWSTRPPKQ